MRTHSSTAAGCVLQGYRPIGKQRAGNARRTNVQRRFTSLTNVHCSTFCSRSRTIFFRSHLNVHYPIVYSDHWAIVIVLTRSTADRFMIVHVLRGAPRARGVRHWQDRSHLVWAESQFEQTTQPRAPYPDQLRDHHPYLCCSRSGRPTRIWAVHEAAHRPT